MTKFIVKPFPNSPNMFFVEDSNGGHRFSSAETFPIKDFNKKLCMKVADLLNKEYDKVEHMAKWNLLPDLKWKPIETAPHDKPHVRGVWVFTTYRGKRVPNYFEMDAGYVDDETGLFILMNGDPAEWHTSDYHWWAPLPDKIPPRPEAKDAS